MEVLARKEGVEDTRLEFPAQETGIVHAELFTSLDLQVQGCSLKEKAQQHHCLVN